MMTRLQGWLVPILLLGTMAYAIAEEITLTTYYPSPRGVYDQLRTAGDVQIGSIIPPGASGGPAHPPPRLYVAQDTSTTAIDPTTLVAPALQVDRRDSTTGTLSPLLIINEQGNVGIGLAGPQAKLDVDGGIKVGDMSAGSPQAGTLRWNSGKLQVFRDLPAPAQWVDLATGGGPSGSGTVDWVAKWLGASALGDSQIRDDGTSVMIGPLSLTQKLQVDGNIALGQNYFGAIGTSRFVGLTGGTTSGGGTSMNATSGTAMEIAQVSGPGGNPSTALHFHTFEYGSNGGARRVTISNAGEVGIGTSSPSKKLEVAGDIGATQVCIGSGCRSKWGIQLERVPVATLTAQQQPACTAANIASGSNWWLPCQSACNRYCQSQGFIGGSLVEYDPDLGANCLCTQ